MPKDFLEDVLNQFARVTKVILDSAQAKEDLDRSRTNADLKDVLERTKTQVESLCDLAKSLKRLFFKQYEEISQKLEAEVTVNGDKSDNEDKPAIKLVDINKLVDHNKLRNAKVQKRCARNNTQVRFDSSVVVISSSDEEANDNVKKPANNNVKTLPVRKPPAQRRAVNSKTLKNGKSRRKKDILELQSSETSSSNSDSSKSTEKTSSENNNAKSDQEDEEDSSSSSSSLDLANIDWKSDKKFNSECYVRVLKVPCEKLKEYYLEKLELLEINKLKDLKPLKRSRTRSKKVTSEEKAPESGSSSDNPKPKKKSNNKEKENCKSNSENEEEVPGECSPDKDTSRQDEVDMILDSLLSDGEENNDLTPDDLDNQEEGAEKTNKNTEEANGESSKQNPENGDTNEVNGDNKNSDDDGKKKKSRTSDKEEDSEDEEKTKKKDKDDEKSAWRKDKLLTMNLSSSDSEEEISKFKKKKEQKDSDRKGKKRSRKAVLSDSDSDEFKQQSSSSSSESSESEKENDKKKEEEEKKKTARKRVKRMKDSSDDDDDKTTRKQIRGIIGRDSLAEATKRAEAEERERKARILEKQKKYNQIYESSFDLNATVDKLVLDFDEDEKEELLAVDADLVKKLKPHQASGVRFMWDACFESLKRAKKTTGSGCILAHCMGLGKTLQVVTLTHTLLTNAEQTKVRKVLVVCPLNTVLNWVNEYKQWIPDNDDYEVYELISSKQVNLKHYQVKTWHECGGVLIIGYEMFRNLTNPENKRISKKMRNTFSEALVDPGPDLVICDEGHLLKNEKTNISIAMNRLRTLRRIVLTGTPLQNNLKEYFCMVQFIKPNLLGTYKEYLNRFVNPITNGQYTDSTPHDIQIMRKRSHVLHKMLDGVVQRRDYSVLQPYLPPKHEYVLFLNLTEVQIKLYQYYMDHYARKVTESGRTSFLFVDFQSLQRICTHPRVLLDKSIEMKNARDNRDTDEESEGSLKDFIDDNDASSSSDKSSSSSNSDSDAEDDAEKKSKSKQQKKRVTRAAAASARENGDVIEIVEDTPQCEKEWWQEICDGDELDVITHSSKLFLLFEILKECEQIGDKVLVFSQSLYSLNVIEYFLDKIHEATEAGKPESVAGFSGSWCLGLDYFRLDGSSSCDNRAAQCKMFNNPNNTRARLFLISTRAGGLGINLVAANRVIIFDVSWNPSHDIQSIYRVYRFGQTKPSYVYRFVTNGTMEMKIYERQVTKQAISKRVIDEQQIDRHYNQNDLQELYKFDPSTEDRPTPLVPKDVLLGELLQKHEDRIYSYHEHQSLLENKEEEGLNEEERKAAWEEFENEKKQRHNLGGNRFPNAQAMSLAIMSILRKENPAFTDDQLRALLPTVHAQLQEQVSKGDLSMYKRVQQEVQIMQILHNQRLKEQYYQAQTLRLLQQQQQLQGVPNVANFFSGLPGTSRDNVSRFNPNEVIDLNE